MDSIHINHNVKESGRYNLQHLHQHHVSTTHRPR